MISVLLASVRAEHDRDECAGFWIYRVVEALAWFLLAASVSQCVRDQAAPIDMTRRSRPSALSEMTWRVSWDWMKMGPNFSPP